MFTSLRNSKKGFTLIELLVVIAIIGILSSVVLAALSTARAKSRDAKRISDVGQIKVALELYFDSFQSYPSTTPICSPACARPADTDAAVQLLTQKSFLQQTPIPPAGGSAFYVYVGTQAGANCTAVGTECTSYGLGVTLERSDNPALTSDADQVVGTVLIGNSQDCVTAASAAEACYDIKV